jgi:hypothetical protein
MITPKTAIPVASQVEASQDVKTEPSGAGLNKGNKEQAFRALLWLSLVYFAVRLPWLMCLPMTEAPDEGNHLWVAQFLRNHLRLPGAAEVANAGTPAVYGSLPQLGYLPHVLVGQLFSPEQFQNVARFGSLLIGLPTVWFAWLLAKELFADSSGDKSVNRLHRMALPLLVMFHPQLAFTQSYTNNDTLATTLSSAAIYLSVTVIRRGVSNLHGIAFGAILGLAALSKYTTLTLVPVIVSVLLVAGLLNGLSASAIALSLVLFIATFSVSCGWWFFRNYAEYSSDILGTRTMYETWSQILPRENGQIVNPWPPVQKFSWWRFVFFDFWGLFGYMNRYLWRPFYIALLILSGTSIVGWVGSLRSSRTLVGLGAASAEQKKSFAVWVTLLSCVLLNFASVLQVTLSNVSGPHGRYLFPSELAIMALLLAGFSKFQPVVCKVFTWMLFAICVAANLSGFLMYYCP